MSWGAGAAFQGAEQAYSMLARADKRQVGVDPDPFSGTRFGLLVSRSCGAAESGFGLIPHAVSDYTEASMPSVWSSSEADSSR